MSSASAQSRSGDVVFANTSEWIVMAIVGFVTVVAIIAVALSSKR